MAKPTLVWLAENNLLNGQKVEASYLTNGINWRSDYVVTLNDKDDKADLSGWVTIDNKSGATYRNAKLKLVAGDVNRAKDETDYKDRMLRVAEMAGEGGCAAVQGGFVLRIPYLHAPAAGHGQGQPDQADQPGPGGHHPGQEGAPVPRRELLLLQPLRRGHVEPEGRRVRRDREPRRRTTSASRCPRARCASTSMTARAACSS